MRIPPRPRSGNRRGWVLPAWLIPLIPLFFLLAYLVAESAYSIQAEEEGILLRFGKYTPPTKQPGLHFKVPFVDRIIKEPVKRQLKQEFGFGTKGATNPNQFLEFRSNRNDQVAEWERQTNMVTGDLNAALVKWTVQYRIDDPYSYLFKVRGAEETLSDASESVMRQVVGDRTVDEVITIGRAAIEAEVLDKLRVLMNKYETGINVSLVQITDVSPPNDVKDSFNDVERAKQEKKEAINLALAAKDQVIPKTKGRALGQVSEAEGYAAQRTNEALGDVAAFNALFEEYLKAPEVTKRRIYLETLSEVMPKLGKKVILDDDAGNVLPLLDLGSKLGGLR